MLNDELVQIQTTPIVRSAGTVSSKHIQNKLYVQAMLGSDIQEEGLRTENTRLILLSHKLIHSVTRTVKNQFCSRYRYPTPDFNDPQRWDVLCQSGSSGKFTLGEKICTACIFFNMEHASLAASTLEEAQFRHQSA